MFHITQSVRLAGILGISAVGVATHGSELASVRGPQAWVSGNGPSSEASLSANGQRVAFASGARNLGTNSSGSGAWQIWLRDLGSGSTQLISRAPDGAAGHGASRAPSIAADGRRVLFESEASDLVVGDSNGQSDLFVADVESGLVSLVSVARGGVGAGRLGGFAGVLSQNGKVAAFRSLSPDLVANDPNANGPDVFVRDLETGTTAAVSRTATGNAQLRRLERPALASDGSVVAFQAGEGATSIDIHVRNRTSGQLYVLSTNANALLGVAANWARVCGPPVLSADGRFVAYRVTVSTGSGNTARSVVAIRWHDLVGGASAVASTNAVDGRAGIDDSGDVAITPDGTRLAYLERGAGGTARILRLWDSVSGTSSAIAVAAPGEPEGPRWVADPVFSGDGAMLFFASGPTNGHFQAYSHTLATAMTQLLSAEPVRGGPSQGSSEGIQASHDGAVVAFVSRADDLVAGDFNGTWDVFVRRGSPGIELASRVHPDRESATADGASSAGPGAFSSDGLRLAFTTDSRGLSPLDGNGRTDVYLRDFAAGTLSLISVAEGGLAAGNGPSRRPTLSADGRWCAFESDASDLVPGDGNGLPDVFLRDLAAGQTRWISRHPSTGDAGNGRSTAPQLSADGKWMGFASASTNLAELGERAGYANLYVYRVDDGALRLVSTARPEGADLDTGDHRDHWVAPDGRWILYSSSGVRLSGSSAATPGIVLWDATTGQGKVLASGPGSLPLGAVASADGLRVAFQGPAVDRTSPAQVMVLELPSAVLRYATLGERPHLSADGRWLAFQRYLTNALSGDPAIPAWEVVVADLQAGTEEGLDGPLPIVPLPGGGRWEPLLNHDGSLVAFRSRSTVLTTGDENGKSDWFLRDRRSGSTSVLSRSLAGGTGDHLTGQGFLSTDGESMVFESYATDLVSGDHNAQKDLFVVRLQGGSASPRILTLTRVSTGDVTVVWESQPGLTYRVQARDEWGSGSWTELPGEVTAQATSAALTDSGAAGKPRQFYRIRVIESGGVPGSR